MSLLAALALKVSAILLVALIGAVAVARSDAESDEGEPGEGSEQAAP